MKNYEVGIIVAAIVIIGFIWWQSQSATVANPTNATSPGYNPMLSNPVIT
jgi:hypothetical protein